MKKTVFLSLLSFLSIPALAAPQPASVTPIVNKAFSEAEVLDAQQGWCKALVDISSTYQKKGHREAEKLARNVINNAYGYDMGVVLFKPTLTVNPQTFRTTSEGALSYFVGGNKKFPKDKGFALKGWTKCVPENSAIFISGNTATTMGKVHFMNKDGTTTVDKTWQFIKDDKGNVKIVLHHSSLEYTE